MSNGDGAGAAATTPAAVLPLPLLRVLARACSGKTCNEFRALLPYAHTSTVHKAIAAIASCVGGRVLHLLAWRVAGVPVGGGECKPPLRTALQPSL